MSAGESAQCTASAAATGRCASGTEACGPGRVVGRGPQSATPQLMDRERVGRGGEGGRRSAERRGEEGQASSRMALSFGGEYTPLTVDRGMRQILICSFRVCGLVICREGAGRTGIVPLCACSDVARCRTENVLDHRSHDSRVDRGRARQDVCTVHSIFCKNLKNVSQYSAP